MPDGKQGSVFIIAAASGTGKTTLVAQLLKLESEIKLSVSHTTRMPREGEIHGQHYFFTSVPDFQTRIDQNEFLEYAQVYDQYYGTSCAWIHDTLKQGHDVLLEIDVQGAKQVKERLPDVISIFILPPSLAELERRLTSRQTDSIQNVEKRLSLARHEIEQARYFDYVLINDDLSEALHELMCIVHAERLKTQKQLGVLQNLLAND
ncbi:guanylate kinase [Neisseria sp. Ec49-e6-T10]|uniref:guanylate kinase n=1 Tax=Neisseria sp. Ec49-e6-T10 TaxID=3140744 RepID=UPI003EB6DEE7